jgi:hypothetical protein
MRALAMKPEERYQSARELQVDLEAFIHEQRIRVSPAALAEWMERTFGPKQEIWHTLPPPGLPSEMATALEATAATKIVAHENLSGALAAMPASFSLPIELSRPVRPPRRRRWPFGAAVLVLAGAASVWLARDHLGGALKATETSSPVVLVAEGGHVAVERTGASTAAPRNDPPAAAPVPAPATAPTPPTSGSGRPVPTSPRSKRTPEAGGSPRAASFSATFARREGEIRRCFVDHPEGSSAMTEISLRFEVGRDGQVGSVAVLPAAIGGSPLGACLAAVGKGTVFSKQTAPVTFRIPLTVQRETAGKNGP